MAVLVNTAVDLATLLTPLLGPSGLNLEITIPPLGKRPKKYSKFKRSVGYSSFERTVIRRSRPAIPLRYHFDITFISIIVVESFLKTIKIVVKKIFDRMHVDREKLKVTRLCEKRIDYNDFE